MSFFWTAITFGVFVQTSIPSLTGYTQAVTRLLSAFYFHHTHTAGADLIDFFEVTQRRDFKSVQGEPLQESWSPAVRDTSIPLILIVTFSMIVFPPLLFINMRQNDTYRYRLHISHIYSVSMTVRYFYTDRSIASTGQLLWHRMYNLYISSGSILYVMSFLHTPAGHLLSTTCAIYSSRK